MTLIGATTENPSFEVIAPLLSRASVLVLEPLARGRPARAHRARARRSRARARRARADARAGGARLPRSSRRTATRARRSTRSRPPPTWPRRARASRAHAWRSSRRRRSTARCATTRPARSTTTSSPPSSRACAAATPTRRVYWLMRMLEAGEDPLFVARRMVIFAAEDVGNADPQALARRRRGQGRGPLRRPARRAASRSPQAAVYLATAPKSNASYKAMLAAADDVAAARAAARAAAPAQRADAADEGARLRHGLPVRARPARTRSVEHAHLPDGAQRPALLRAATTAERALAERPIARALRQRPVDDPRRGAGRKAV